MSEPQQPYTPTTEPAAPPRKKRHIFRWVFLAIQVAFVVWLISGIASASNNCDGQIGDALKSCQAGTSIGAGIGVFLIIILWAMIDIILGITYLIVRKRA